MTDVNTSMDTLSVRLGALHADVGEIKVALGKLSDAIVKLALVEERQSQTAVALERAFSAIERLEAKVEIIERDSPGNSRIRRLVDQFSTGAVIILLLYAAKFMGLV